MINVKDYLFSNFSNKQVLVKNTLWLGAIEVVSKLIMLLVTVSLVRYLGPSKFGAYNFAFSYVAILMVFSDLGVGTIITREVAKHKDKTESYLANALGLRLITSMVIMILMFVTVGWTQSSLALILWVTLYNIALQFQGLLLSILNAYEKMEYVFGVKLFYYLGVLVVAMITVATKSDVMSLLSGYFTVTIVALAAAIYFINKLGIKIGVGFEKKGIVELIKESAPIFGFIASSQIYANIDTLVISKYFGNEAIGIYQAAYKILFAFQSVNIINSATFPRISVLIHEQKTESLNKLLRLIIFGSLAGLGVLGIAISWNSELIVKTIYNSAYIKAAPILGFLIWAGIVNYFRVLLTNILIAKNMQKWVFVSVMMGLAVNLVLNWLLIPRIGFAQAGMNLLISEVIILASEIYYIRR